MKLHPNTEFSRSLGFQNRRFLNENRIWWNMKEIHGRCHRQFSDEQGAEIACTIISDSVAVGKLLAFHTFRPLTAQFLSDHGRDWVTFKLSLQFILHFKRRARFSSKLLNLPQLDLSCFGWALNCHLHDLTIV
jgi:hypothetical protein